MDERNGIIHSKARWWRRVERFERHTLRGPCGHIHERWDDVLSAVRHLRRGTDSQEGTRMESTTCG